MQVSPASSGSPIETHMTPSLNDRAHVVRMKGMKKEDKEKSVVAYLSFMKKTLENELLDLICHARHDLRRHDLLNHARRICDSCTCDFNALICDFNAVLSHRSMKSLCTNLID